MVLRNFTASLLLCSFAAHASEVGLSALKKEQIAIDKQLNDKKSTNLKYDWIKPIIASYSYSVNDQYTKENRARYFRISLDQPIFRSGGIYFAIKYANASRAFLSLSTRLKENNFIQSLYVSVLNLHKIDLQIEKLKLQIQNSEIDVIRKREQFESGLIDSSFLDAAILAKSKQEQLLLDSKERRFSLLQNYKNIADVSYHDIRLPKFEMVDEAEFIAKNIALQSAKVEKTEARYLKNMTISNYLPTVALFGEYANRKDSFRLFNQNNESKTYGVKISMPLFDINRGRTIEIKKLEYLQAKLRLKDTEREVRHTFENFKHTIDILKQRQQLSQKDVTLYRGLVRVAKEGERAGDKTASDVKTLQNSQKMAELDAKIFEVEIQEQFLSLYARISDAF